MVRILILALLLCAEASGEPIEGRWLVAQTVMYRMQTGRTFEEVVYAPKQYYGAKNLDVARSWVSDEEWAENVQLALLAAMGRESVEVSSFCQTGRCYWESSCQPVKTVGQHSFYLCPEW